MVFCCDTDSFSVSLNGTRNIVVLHWKKHISLSEFQDGIREFVRVLEETSAKCSLIDSTQRGPLQPEADEWIFNALLQEVKNVEIEGHQLALVMTEDRYKNMVQDYSLSQARLMQLPIQFSYFTRMEEAMHWLLQE